MFENSSLKANTNRLFAGWDVLTTCLFPATLGEFPSEENLGRGKHGAGQVEALAFCASFC